MKQSKHHHLEKLIERIQQKYNTNLCFPPSCFLFFIFVYKDFLNKQIKKKKQEKEELLMIPSCVAVDTDACQQISFLSQNICMLLKNKISSKGCVSWLNEKDSSQEHRGIYIAKATQVAIGNKL